MSNGYIKPSRAAVGPGSKNFFSTFDLYLLKLFTSLVERGFPREEAALRVKLLRGSLFADRGNSIDLISFVRKDEKGQNSGHPEILLATDPKGFADDAQLLLNDFLKHDCDDILIINFRKIRAEVDSALADCRLPHSRLKHDGN